MISLSNIESSAYASTSNEVYNMIKALKATNIRVYGDGDKWTLEFRSKSNNLGFLNPEDVKSSILSAIESELSDGYISTFDDLADDMDTSIKELFGMIKQDILDRLILIYAAKTSGKKGRDPSATVVMDTLLRGQKWSSVRARMTNILPSVLRELMGENVAPRPTGYLVWRTGRFAENVRFGRISLSPKGVPTISYTYMKNPYDVHDPQRRVTELIEEALSKALLSSLVSKEAMKVASKTIRYIPS